MPSESLWEVRLMPGSIQLGVSFISIKVIADTEEEASEKALQDIVSVYGKTESPGEIITVTRVEERLPFSSTAWKGESDGSETEEL